MTETVSLDDCIQRDIADHRRWRHKKTGNLYEVLSMAVDCTNARDGTVVVIYYRVGCVDVPQFVREVAEFRAKFEPVENHK